MNDNKNKRKIVIGSLKGDFKLLWIATQRIVRDIIDLIKTIEFPAGNFIPIVIRSNWKWIVLSLLLLIIILFSFKCCGGEIEDTSYSDVTEKPYTFTYKPSVEVPAVAHRISNISYSKGFNDMNDTHLAVAKKIGIKPLESRENVNEASRALVEIDDYDAYVVDSLTHSVPYLVPEAAALLSRIGKNFQDSLVMKHLPPHKLIVTSVLRTKHDVKRLKRGNVNSSANSAHCYGTTFDISWKRFFSEYGETTENAAKLKSVFAEVLRDLKKQGSCYVKHEKKQACYHITARAFPKE